MLHEILLSLSGQPSPLLDPEFENNGASFGPFPLLSPPEKALLASLARLSRLHSLLRSHTARISSSHPSTICRAVSTAISTEQLGRFQKKILDVEKAVLGKDSGYVGGYGIVPLSMIVSEFAPWTRRLEWLWEVARFMQPGSSNDGRESTILCSGASLIDYLRAESHTGYLDLEEIALQLVRAAETAWMRQLSMWLLYGELPTFGRNDFFVQATEAEADDDERGSSRGSFDFAIHVDLLPKFISNATASSILFIGKSLNHIRMRRNRSTIDVSSGSVPGITLDGHHIRHLSSLKSPISSTALSKAVTEIRLSLSQTALSKLLPLPKIVEILSLIHGFLLLGRGEFAMALVSQADSRVQARHRRPGDQAGGLDGIVMKEGEVIAALSQTWTELYSLQNEEDPVDEELDLARELLHISIHTSKKGGRLMTPSRDATGVNLAAEISGVSFDDLLFPTSTSLSLRVQPPIDLFLVNSDISVYSIIHSYLLGIRRAQIRLGNLWKRTAMRRVHPSPWGPPRSNTRGGESRLRAQRARQNARTIQMRPIWATASACIFVLSEVGGYLQGEVIQESWQHFRQWLEGAPSGQGSVSRSASRPGTASASRRPGTGVQPSDAALTGSFQHSIPSFPQQQQQPHQQHDPETVTVAHRRYLSALTQSLFLTEVPFTSALRSFLTSVDHLVALVSRLETVQRNLDLESDEGIVDALADYAQEERTLWEDLRESRGAVETGIQEMVARLRDIDDSRSGEGRRLFDMATTTATPGITDRNMYIPRKTAGVDRLLMKLDSGSFSSGGGDDGLQLQRDGGILNEDD